MDHCKYEILGDPPDYDMDSWISPVKCYFSYIIIKFLA